MTTTSQLNSGQLPGTKSSATSEEKSKAITFVGRNVHDFFDDMPWFKLTRTAVEVDSRGVREKCRAYPDHVDFISAQSAEILCHIFSFLPIQDVLKMQSQNKKMQHAVMLYLKLLHSIDFGYGEILSTFPSSMTDSVLMRLMEKCPHLENIYGFHPPELTPRRFRNCPSLSVPGCIDAFLVLPRLQGVEISDPALFEAILTYLPHLHIIGAFRNRASPMSKDPFSRLTFPASPNVTTLNLTGVTVPEIPRLTTVRHLFLHCVHLTHPLPFRDFLAPMLETFVMANCAGPSHSLKYVSLFTGLAAARNLSRLELIRVPFLGGIFQHIVEDSWRVQGFQKLRKVTMAACKFALELDLGFLAITAAQRLEEMLIQPSLARDSFFSALKVSEAMFPNFKRLTLGHIDFFGQSKADKLILADVGELFGISEVKENPALITDMGMAAAAQCFPALTCLTIYNCPHLHLPHTWLISGMNTWVNLQHLSLYSSHAMGLESLESLVAQLRSLTTLFLESMFREPPKGCSRVGLSAGTGLGVSAALVQNHNSLTNHANGPPVVDAYASEENDSEDSDEEERLGQEGEGREDAHHFRQEENADEAEMMEINNNDPIMEDVEENINEDSRNRECSLVNDESRFAESRQGGYSSSLQDIANNKDISNGSSGNPKEVDLASSSELVRDVKQIHSQASGFHESRSGIPQHAPQDLQTGSASRRVDFHSKGDENPTPCCSTVHSQEACLSPRLQDDARKLIAENQQSSNIQVGDLNNISDSYIDRKQATPSTSSAESPWQLKVASSFHSEDGEGKTTTVVLLKEQTRSLCCSQKQFSEHDSENNSNVDGDNRRLLTCDLQDVDSCRTRGQASPGQALEEFSPDSEALSQSRKLAEETSAWLQWDSSSEFDELHHSWDPSFADRECSHSLTTSGTGDTVGLSSSAAHMFSSDGHLGSVHDSSSMSTVPPCHTQEKKAVIPGHTSCKSSVQATSQSQKNLQECALPCATSSGQQSCGGGECNSAGSLDFLNCAAGPDQDEISPNVCDQLCFSSEYFKDDTGMLREKTGTSVKHSSVKRSLSSKQYHHQKHEQAKPLKTENSRNSHDQVLASCGLNEMQSLAEEGSSCPFPRTFKGKGLLGRKKSVAKRSRGLTDESGLADLPCSLCSYRKDKWCQASNDEIRDSIRRAREQEESAVSQGRRSRASSLGSTSSSRKSLEEIEVLLVPVSGDGEMPRAGARHCTCLSRTGKGSPIMVSKATSTSDPVYEEDHVQVLKLRSDSLAHVTLRMVGITDLRVIDCPRLKSVRGSACRVLRSVKVERSPQLRRMHWGQCTKLDIRSLLQSACQAMDGPGSTIFLRPMVEINEEELTQELLTLPDIKKHVCVVFDYSPNPSATLYNQHRIENWADLFNAINSFCLDKLQQPKGNLRASDMSFISRQGCYSLKGVNCDDSVWRLTTDFPWLRHMSRLQDNALKELPWYCQKAGLFCKEKKGYTKNADCVEALMPVLKDNNKVPLYEGTIFIYINMCDATGVPTPDIYV